MTTRFSGLIFGGGTDRRRWMLFVDGENLTARAQQVARSASVGLSEGPYYSRDVCVWFPDWPATRGMEVDRESIPLQPNSVRAYYYTSVVGDEKQIKSVKEALFELRFTPKVFKRTKTRRSKAVDISLATDMLGHAYRGDYDVAVLFAGDGDYVPLVEEVKRLGKNVRVAFFEESGLSDDLRLAADTVMYPDEFFLGVWKEYKQIES
jgi:NYN domain